MGERSINPKFNVHENYKKVLIINPYRFISGGSLLLDTYTGAAAAYSLRLLRSAYTGALVKIRRSSDDATKDFYPDSNNVLSLNSEDGSGTSLSSWISSGDGYVNTWYDQSGNGKDISESTTSRQPQIVSSGAVLTENSKASIDFGVSLNARLYRDFGANISQPFMAFVVHKWKNVSVAYLFDGYQLSNRQLTLVEYANWKFGSSGPGNSFNIIDGGGSYTNQNLLALLWNGSSSKSYSNGSLERTETGMNSNDYRPLTLGNRNTNSAYAYSWGKIQEFILYNSDESSNQSGIATNINNFYSIY